MKLLSYLLGLVALAAAAPMQERPHPILIGPDGHQSVEMVNLINTPPITTAGKEVPIFSRRPIALPSKFGPHPEPPLFHPHDPSHLDIFTTMSTFVHSDDRIGHHHHYHLNTTIPIDPLAPPLTSLTTQQQLDRRNPPDVSTTTVLVLLETTTATAVTTAITTATASAPAASILTLTAPTVTSIQITTYTPPSKNTPAPAPAPTTSAPPTPISTTTTTPTTIQQSSTTAAPPYTPHSPPNPLPTPPPNPLPYPPPNSVHSLQFTYGPNTWTEWYTEIRTYTGNHDSWVTSSWLVKNTCIEGGNSCAPT
ncbi:MAG: hypothetical protein Q9202_005741 [Teloschistes flavicans]